MSAVHALRLVNDNDRAGCADIAYRRVAVQFVLLLVDNIFSLAESVNIDNHNLNIRIDIEGKDGKVSRKAVTVRPGADLYKLSGNRSLYEGYAVSGIDCTPGMEQIELSNTDVVRLGKAMHVGQLRGIVDKIAARGVVIERGKMLLRRLQGFIPERGQHSKGQRRYRVPCAVVRVPLFRDPPGKDPSRFPSQRKTAAPVNRPSGAKGFSAAPPAYSQ